MLKIKIPHDISIFVNIFERFLVRHVLGKDNWKENCAVWIIFFSYNK